VADPDFVAVAGAERAAAVLRAAAAAAEVTPAANDQLPTTPAQ
jgi:hypothetical protein